MEEVDFTDWSFEEDQPKVKTRPWMLQKILRLGTVSNIDEIIDRCIASGRYALDLETSGLDNRVFNGRTVDHIAGICLSPDGVRGYYIPIAHDSVLYGKYNVPPSVWRPAMKRLIESDSVAVFHNGKFDHEFLQFNGGEPLGEWDKPSEWEDTLILAYLRNTRARRKGLKELSETSPDADWDSVSGGPGLGMEMIKLHELWGHDKQKTRFNYDFTKLDPSWEPAILYAASDAICTYLLYDVLHPTLTDGCNQTNIYKIEKLCVAATRWMERPRIFVPRDKVEELVALGQQEWFDAILGVYKEASKILGRNVMPGFYKALHKTFIPDDPLDPVTSQIKRAKSVSQREFPDPVAKVRGAQKKDWPPIYDVNAPVQLGIMFDEMGIKGLKRTAKSGQVKTSKDELDRLEERQGKKYPFLMRIKRFRETWKALSTYLYPMLFDCDPVDSTMRINFQAHRVDTGRFSTPTGGRKNRIPGWPKVNIHSIPSTYDPNRPACMTRLRECIGSRLDYFIVAIDYSGVELRLVTNLSLEPKWLVEFFRCSSCGMTFDKGEGSETPKPPPPRCPNCGSDKIGDLHTLTTIEIYGENAQNKPEWKKLRGMGKATNFALSYGGGFGAVMASTGCDKNEGHRIKHTFDQSYQGLQAWWRIQKAFAKQCGFVVTAFNRKYPVPDIHSADRGFRAKAERNAINGPIQGSSADVTKIAMALVYKEFKKRGWLDKARLLITMHDELVFEMHKSILEEAIEVATQIMTSNGLVLGQRWAIPLTTDVEIGNNWMVPWDLGAMRAGEVRFIGDQKFYKASDLPEGHDWDSLESFPAALQGLFSRTTLDEGGSPPSDPSPSGGTPSETPPTENPPENPTPTPSLTAPSQQEVSIPMPPPPLPRATSSEYVYKMGKPLTLMTMLRLAKVIQASKDTGTQMLRLVSLDGMVLDGWREQEGVPEGVIPEVLVSPSRFEILAELHGL